MVEKLLQQVGDKRSDKHFQALYSKTKYYASTVNSKLEDNSIDVEVELDFKEKRTSKKKVMPGEKSINEASGISTAQNYKLVFFSVLDCARTSIEEIFSPKKEILEDCSWLDPKKFNEIVMLDSFPTEVLCSISKLCKVERSQLLIELKQFAD